MYNYKNHSTKIIIKEKQFSIWNFKSIVISIRKHELFKWLHVVLIKSFSQFCLKNIAECRRSFQNPFTQGSALWWPLNFTIFLLHLAKERLSEKNCIVPDFRFRFSLLYKKNLIRFDAEFQLSSIDAENIFLKKGFVLISKWMWVHLTLYIFNRLKCLFRI